MEDATLVFWVASIAKIGYALVIILLLAPLIIWAERRQSAMIQDRVGPHRAHLPILGKFGKKITVGGLLHPLADALKMVWKEDFVPPKADKFLHALAPVITIIPAIVTFAVIPFGDTLFAEAAINLDILARDAAGNYCVAEFFPSTQTTACIAGAASSVGTGIPLQIAPLNMGVLFLFAVAGTGVIGAAVGGYASDNKFSLLGGLRAAGQMVSYEVALGLTLVGCFMVFGTLRPEVMVQWQVENYWGIVVQPFAFLLYITAAVAETKRIPFDAPEGESELAGGYLTEYSGMKFGMFFTGEFVEVIVLAALAVTIFLGGYDSWPIAAVTGPSEVSLLGVVAWPAVPHIVIVLIQMFTFISKVVLLIWFQIQIRWTLPRFRYDQIMALCWKVLLPAALINIFITGVVILLLQGS